MAKAEWGAKRACPKCGTRFYDLGKDDPVTCINCGTAWAPEPILKSKQPQFEPAKVAAAEAKPDQDLVGAEDELDVDEDAEVNPDEEVDIGTDDDDLGVGGVSGDEEI